MADLKSVLAGGAVAVVLAGSAMAVTSSNFKYSEPKTGYLTFAPEAFRPLNSEMSDNFKSDIRFFSAASPTGDQLCGVTPVHLPEKAIVEILDLEFAVPSSSTLSISLYRRNLFGGEFRSFRAEHLVNSSLQGSGAGKLISGFWRPNDAYAKIKNEDYVYVLRICMDPDVIVSGARIRYTYSSAGD